MFAIFRMLTVGMLQYHVMALFCAILETVIAVADSCQCMTETTTKKTKKKTTVIVPTCFWFQA